MVLGYLPEANGPDEISLLLAYDGKCHPMAALELFLVAGDPFFGHPISIRMRNVDGHA